MYEIHCDICGGSNITWSEYEKHIWCFDCLEDTKGDGGIFDGPIPLNTAMLMGISFDRIRLSDGKLIEMVIDERGKITWPGLDKNEKSAKDNIDTVQPKGKENETP